jgi:hypothetical protein
MARAYELIRTNIVGGLYPPGSPLRLATAFQAVRNGHGGYP